MRKSIAVSFVILISLLIGSCNKIEESSDSRLHLNKVEKRFLNIGQLKSASSDAEQEFINKITADLAEQNELKSFIQEFVDTYGYPDWAMARWFDNNNIEVAQIPVLLDEDTETRAVLLCMNINQELRYKLFTRESVFDYSPINELAPTQQKLIDLFIIFDFQHFKQSSFLPNGKVLNNDQYNKLKGSFIEIEIETCYWIVVSSGDWSEAPRLECEYQYRYDYIPSFSNFSNGMEGGPGGSITPTDFQGEGGHDRIGDLGGLPIEPKLYLPDTIDKFPCTRNIIASLRGKLDGKTAIFSNLISTIFDVFEISEHIDLTIEFGQTPRGQNAFNNAKAGSNSFTIIIDCDYMKRASDISIARTIIHEIMHVYLMRKLKLDKATVVEIGEILLDLAKNKSFLSSKKRKDIGEHTFFAKNFVPIIAKNLHDWCKVSGKSISYDYCEMLAWAGLHETSEYQNLSNLVEIEKAISNEQNNTDDAKGSNCD